jgi:hypothetical protein
MSNELNSPSVLFCPTDRARTPATNWSTLANTNISYFVGLDADGTQPQSILSGDRNISGGVLTSNRIMEFRATNVLTWGQDMHVGVGNIGLGNGSVQSVSENGLQSQMLSRATNGLKVARFAVP